MKKNELAGKIPVEEVKRRKTHRKNRWSKTSTYLPTEIIEIVKDLFTDDNHEYSRAIRLMVRIFNKYSVEDKAYYESICLPNEYIKKILTGAGMNIWRVLLDNEILVRTKNWSSTYHIASEYTFNLAINLNNSVRVDYFEVTKRSTAFSRKVKEQLNRVTLDISVDIEDYMRTRVPLIEKSVRRKISGDTYMNSKRQKRKIEGAVENFVIMKVESNKIKQYNQLASIQEKKWRADRNRTNFRLDTNLTNLHGHFIKLLKIDGMDSIKVDLKNSQFVIFSNLLQSVVNNQIDENLLSIGLAKSFYDLVNYNYKGCKMSTMSKQKDLIEFCNLCTDGKIYEVLAEILDLKLENGELDRFSGKQMAFKLFFDQPRNSKRFKLIRERFPTVVEIIDSFKEYMISLEFKEYFNNSEDYQRAFMKEFVNKKAKKWTDFVRRKGRSKFSIMLQQVESKIFIDFIYIPLMDDHTIYSIHDSFLFVDPELKSLIKTKLDKYLPYGYVLD